MQILPHSREPVCQANSRIVGSNWAGVSVSSGRSIRIGLGNSECRNSLLPIREVVFGVERESDKVVISIYRAGINFDGDSVWIVSQWFAPCVENCGYGYNETFCR